MSTSRATEREEIAQAIAYWKTELQDLNIMQLQTDYPHATSYKSGVHSFQLETTVLENLKATFGDIEFSTLIFTSLLVILHHYTLENDLCIGYGLHGLPVRNPLQPNMPFKALLAQTRNSLLQAEQHILPNHIIFNDVLSPETSASLPNKLPFSVIYTPEDSHVIPPEMVKRTYFTLTTKLIDEKCACTIQFNAAMLSPTRIQRLAMHLSRCLHLITQAPDTPIEAISLIAGEEIELIKAYNQPLDQTEHPRVTIGDRLQAIAQEHPNRTAIALYPDHELNPLSLTYEELNVYSNCFANYLENSNLISGEPIGISLPRCLDYYRAQFACIKSTHAFIPLESNPSEQEIIYYKSQSVNTVIVNDQTAPLFKDNKKLKLINLDNPQTQADILAQPFTSKPRPVSPDSPMYHIFTSGTTGKPKQVSIPHAGAENLLAWLTRRYQGKFKHALSVAPYTFDSHIYDTLIKLGTKGTMHVTSNKNRTDPITLDHIINEHHVKFAALTPSIIEMLNPACALDFVVSEGDTPKPSSLRAWLKANPKRIIENGYGPTETTIAATQGEWNPNKGPNLIGKPVDHLRLYILNPNTFEPCPIGALGEIFISGPGVALGYKNNEELSREKFITLQPRPELSEKPQRFYRTGDYACYLEDNLKQINICFCGRKDQRIKIFGVGLDISAIENAIRELPEVKEVLVVPNKSKTGLYAYIVPIVLGLPEQGLLNKVRTHLKETSLFPMIAYPRDIMLVKTIPTNVNGKVDPSQLLPFSRPPKLPNQDSDIEAYLINLWAETLNLDWRCMDRAKDTFASNGGTSIAAGQLIGRLLDPKRPFTFGSGEAVRNIFMDENLTFSSFLEQLSALTFNEKNNSTPAEEKISEKSSTKITNVAATHFHFDQQNTATVETKQSQRFQKK